MSSTQHTGHYNLSQFNDTDKPTWRGDYNGDMSKIDDQMYANAQAAQAAQTAATSATGTAQTASQAAQKATGMLTAMGVTDTGAAAQFKTKVDTAGTDATNALSYLSAMGVTNASQGQSLAASINNKADTSTVASLSAQVQQKANANEVYTQAQSDSRYTQTGGYSGTAQALKTLIDGNTAKTTELETKLSGVQSTANAALPASKIGFWHGGSTQNTDGNAAVSFNVPAPPTATSADDITVIPITNFANKDAALPYNTEVWYVTYQSGQFTVHLRYRQHSQNQWVTGQQPAAYMQAMYIMK